jgi:hypothetical protein
MKTPNPKMPSRRVVWWTAAALFAGVALIAIPKVASYPGRNAPRITETAPARHNPSLRQGLPFSASEVEAYFTEALGTQPKRERNTANFSNPPGEPMENTFAISVQTEESGVAVIFTGRGDYAMNLAREFFEAPFFHREESVRFYALLTHPNVDQTVPLARFTVHFRVVDHPDDFHLTMRFTPPKT